MSNTVYGAVYGLSAAAIWGGMYVVSDVVLKTIPPFTLLSIRLVMAALILGGILWRMKLPIPSRRELVRLLGVGCMGFGVSVGAQFVGTDKSNAVNGALITSASPAFILIFAALILREKLTAQRIAAVALATLGALVIVDISHVDFSSQTFQGNIVLVAAAVTWGLFSVLVRRVSIREESLIVTFYGFLGGLILTVPAAALELPQRPIGTVDGGTILGILYLGVVSMALASWLWNRAFALVDASIASLFFFAQPLVGALLGAVVLKQPITVNMLLGSFLIALGVLLSMVRLTRTTLPAAIRAGD